MDTTNRREKRHGRSRLQRNFAAAVLAFVALFSLASCGGGNEGGGNGGEEQAKEQAKGGNAGGGDGAQTQGSTTGAKPRPFTDIRSIFLATAMNEEGLNGRRARLKGMEVRTLVSERAFYVGENDAERLLIVYVGDEQVQVSEGQKLVVAGALNQPSAQLEEKLSLNEEEVAAMNEQKVFLRAGRVEVREG